MPEIVEEMAKHDPTKIRIGGGGGGRSFPLPPNTMVDRIYVNDRWKKQAGCTTQFLL